MFEHRVGIEALVARVADQTPAAEQVTVVLADVVGSRGFRAPFAAGALRLRPHAIAA